MERRWKKLPPEVDWRRVGGAVGEPSGEGAGSEREVMKKGEKIFSNVDFLETDSREATLILFLAAASFFLAAASSFLAASFAFFFSSFFFCLAEGSGCGLSSGGMKPGGYETM
jgi:hypothetical protein